MRRTIATAAVAAALMLYWVPACLPTDAGRSGPPQQPVADAGEALIHHVRPDTPNPSHLSFRLPLHTVSTAVLFTHDGGLFRNYRNIVGLLLLAMNGLLLASTFSLAAPAVFTLFFKAGVRSDYMETASSFLILLATVVMLWRARKPSGRRSFVLGLSFGAALLFRSSLAFFPPVLALYEWMFRYRRSLRLYWRHLICLCVVPALFLIPWMHMNWVAYRRFVPLEYGEANCNIVTGAMGLVQTIERDALSSEWEPLMQNRRFDGPWNASAYAWALRQISLHPFRYAAAYLSRVLCVFSFNPILMLMALGGLWVHRRREEFRQLGLLACYFIGIHCFMSIQESYFLPLWPLAAILAGALADRCLPRPKIPIAARSYRFSRNFAGACLAAVLALCLVAESIVNSYARGVGSDPRTPESVLDAEIRLHPRDAWLLFERGRRRLKRGEVPAAAADLSNSLALEPNADAELKLAWAKMLLGQPRRLFDRAPSDDADDINALLLKAHGYSRMGQAEQARRELRAAIDAEISGTWARGHTDLELATIAELRRDSLIDEDLHMRLRRLLARRPVKERADLLAALAAAARRTH